MNKVVLLLACMLIQYSASAQRLDSVTLGHKLNSYLEQNFQEKIYVHTDKNSYVAGEIIWFKVYNTEACTNRPVSISKVAYLEILDTENKSVLATKIELANGQGSGSLYLPLNLPSGNYILRSYTNWMKNSDAAFYFHKDISVYNSLKDGVDVPKIAAKQYAIQFFPEGGNLVRGMKSRVAFKAVDNDGNSFSFRAAVLNSAHDTVARFISQKNGHGSFYFTPALKQDYRVLITPANDKTFTATLPQIFEKGAVINLVTAADSVLNVSVQANLENSDSYTLFVRSGRKAVYTQRVPLENLSSGFKVPVSLLGEGVSCFTLFNSAQQPVCERLYFKKPSMAELVISTDKREYAPREKVNISLRETLKGIPLSTSFSISVHRADSLEGGDNDIATYLWMTSELNGNIANASSYLKNYSPEAIDNLMLTHGWRRIKWEDVLQGKQHDPEFLPEMQGHIVSGKIINRNTKEGIAGQNTFLSVPGWRVQLYTSYSSKNGNIHFFTRDFSSTSGIVVQPATLFDSLVEIEISSPYSEKFSEFKAKPFNINSGFFKDLRQRSVAMQVSNAFYGSQLSKVHASNADSSSFYRKPDKVYKLDNYVRFKTMEEVLREYVAEIDVEQKKGDYHLNMFDTNVQGYMNSAPLVMIDGVPVLGNANQILNIDPLKIERLEVVAGRYGYGNNSFPGVASFYSYKGDLAGMQLPRQALMMNYDGLQGKREFYSPMYEGDIATSSRLPDYRTTLFWSTDNETNKDGNANLSFFTSDLAGKYYVVVQSLTENGVAASQATDFTVAEKVFSQNIK